ncbi:MAG: polysaccharide deacetylase family protein [Bacteroidota bacterium]|jgi:hypothetical protein
MSIDSIPIIYYHSIAPAKHPNWPKRYLTLELKYFEEHLKYFKRNGYKFIFLRELIDRGKDSDSHQGDRIVCLTFDDGYVDNFIYVYPLLKKYNAKATIFVNPVFVDKRSVIRKTLEDYWNNQATMDEINKWGFLSWDEMRLMEKSGFVDIQSHTLTHTKYFVSDEITGFHYPCRDSLYVVGNLYPNRLPYYIEDSEFGKLIPYGFPIFEEKSSVIARKVNIKDSFRDEVIKLLKLTDWSVPYNYDYLLNKVSTFYNEAKKYNNIIEYSETENEYKERVRYELKESKDIIETELYKKVEICCWPHGDNNEFAHKMALKTGYKATSLGKSGQRSLDDTRFERFGLGVSKSNMFFTKLKTNYKIKSFYKEQPYYFVKSIYEIFRDII